MFRVMVVDDEPLILAGITSMLEWEKYQCKIVGKAANGQIALQQVEELHPDIVITDIKMPAMDGIEFIRKVRQKGEETAFILLTNLEEFHLVKEAMKLEVVDYLLKLELTEERLLESLEKAIKTCENKRRLRYGWEENVDFELTTEEIMQNYFHSILIQDLVPSSIEEIPSIVVECFQQPVIVLINFNYPFQGFSKEFTRDDQKQVMSYAENIISEMVKRFFVHSCLIRREQNSFILIVSSYQVEAYQKYIQSMGDKMVSVLKDYFEVAVSIAVSRKGEEVTDFADLLYQVTSAMNYYYYDSEQSVIFYSEQCEVNDRHSSNFNIGFLKKDLTQVIRQNDSDGFKDILNQLAALLKEYKPIRSQAVNACSNLYYYIASFFENEEDSDFPYAVNIMGELNRLGSMDQIIQWITWFGKAVGQAIQKKKGTKADVIITLVQNYVMAHYKEKITLSQVAEELNISQGYLSSVFKKQTGNNFSEYVSEIKIEKAKELIETHQYMMYEVSDMLGFDTQYYFSKVFKKVTGFTPREYETVVIKKTNI